MQIDYVELEEQYGDLPVREKVTRSSKPEESLTDNLRLWEPRRNRSQKHITREDKR